MTHAFPLLFPFMCAAVYASIVETDKLTFIWSHRNMPFSWLSVYGLHFFSILSSVLLRWKCNQTAFACQKVLNIMETANHNRTLWINRNSRCFDAVSTFWLNLWVTVCVCHICEINLVHVWILFSFHSIGFFGSCCCFMCVCARAFFLFNPHESVPFVE